MRWKISSNTIYNVGYHIIWCPKYRRKVLIGSIETRLRELLLEKASEIGIVICKMETTPDHLHLFVKTNPGNAPHYIVQQFKGYTSRVMRQEFKSLRTTEPKKAPSRG